jgi:hypothetical protein
MMSVVVALGLLGAVLWQAGILSNIPGVSDLMAYVQAKVRPPATAPREEQSAPQDQPAQQAQDQPVQQTQDQQPTAEPTPATPAAPSTAPGADQQAPQTAQQAARATSPAVEPPAPKPSPLGPRGGGPVADNQAVGDQTADKQNGIDAPPIQQVVRIPRGRSQQPQDLWVTSNPPGAKAVLDDDLSQTCRTPCMLHGAAGTHHLTVSQAGYLNEYRELHVGDTAQDVPLIALREASGTLMVTTVPSGASVRINGQLVQQLTPAAITLRPGTYSVTVEKGGRSQTEKVEVQQNPVFLQIPLGQ